MKYSIVYSSSTGDTEKLAEAIKNKVDECYFGKPSDEALEADIIFIGFWAKGNSCGDDIKNFIEKLSDKKIFVFGTAGYNNTKEYFKGILDSVKALIPESNTIVGSYMCQGKVSDIWKDNLKKNKPEKYELIKEGIAESIHHPNENDIKGLIAEIDNLNL